MPALASVLRCFLAVVLALLAGLAPAVAATPVRVGITNASSDVTFFIADKKGYFREEGLDVTLIPFDSAARMIAPLGAGQLDVGGGSSSAALYNAAARGVGVKIVADKGSTPPGYALQPLLVRKDHVDSGRFKTLKDLKGMKIAGSAPGSASNSTLNEILKKAGLKPADVDRQFMGFPQHVLALQNKAIDASLTTEPSATRAVQSGAAVRVMGDDEAYPHHQLAVVLYGGDFVQKNRDAARRFMRAYIRAARFYNDALKDGRLAGPAADEVIAILTQSTAVKDAAVYRSSSPHWCNPDGKVHEASLKNDFKFFKEQGLIEGNVGVDQVLDTTFAEEVLKDLGPYRPKGGGV